MTTVETSADPRVGRNERINLRERFLKLQEKMCYELENHEDEEHGPTKGEAHEDHWIPWLREYLPNRYSVDKAFAIDSDGFKSEQIDVVVYDQQYTPFIFREKARTYVPAESVYAIFEVKQVLDRANVQAAARKAASVRRLRRTSTHVHHVEGTAPPKEPGNILAGILTYRGTTDWADPLGDRLEAVLREQDEYSQIDIGCALRAGAFRAVYEEGFAMSRSVQGEALITFFLKFQIALRRLGTVPAIDLLAYSEALDSF